MKQNKKKKRDTDTNFFHLLPGIGISGKQLQQQKCYNIVGGVEVSESFTRASHPTPRPYVLMYA
jgi:hypothetical protein